MTTEREEFKYRLDKFMQEAVNLSSAWFKLDGGAENAVSADYPFAKSFDEVAMDICTWYDSVCKGLADVSEKDGYIKYAEFCPYDGCKYYCAFNFDDSTGYAEVTGAEHHEDEDEWYFFCFSDWCEYEKVNDTEYLCKFFEDNEANGYGSGNYSSLEELIKAEGGDDGIALLLKHFLH